MEEADHLKIERTLEWFMEDHCGDLAERTTKVYRRVLGLFKTFLRDYHPSISGWGEIDRFIFSEYLGYFYVRKWAGSPTGARETLSKLRVFSRWVSENYEVPLWERYEPAYERYKETLPAALEADKIMHEELKEDSEDIMRNILLGKETKRIPEGEFVEGIFSISEIDDDRVVLRMQSWIQGVEMDAGDTIVAKLPPQGVDLLDEGFDVSGQFIEKDGYYEMSEVYFVYPP